jgi:AmmeMemoRadiSam system protein A
MLSPGQNQQLLQIARRSIAHGLKNKVAPNINPDAYPEELREILATFVTLKINSQLRGCIGTTQAVSPLAVSVNNNAYSSAFRDPRFKPLAVDEFKIIHISISILTQALPMTFTSEIDLLQQLRPGIDGLIIQKDNLKATFLPSVWEQLKNPEHFLRQLKLKAGMRPEISPNQAWRYQAISVEE